MRWWTTVIAEVDPALVQVFAGGGTAAKTGDADRVSHLRNLTPLLFLDIGGQRRHRTKGGFTFIHIFDLYAELLVHQNNQLDGIKGVKAEAVIEERHGVADVFRSGLQSQPVHQQFFDFAFYIVHFSMCR